MKRSPPCNGSIRWIAASCVKHSSGAFRRLRCRRIISDSTLKPFLRPAPPTMPPTDENSEPRAAIGLFALKDDEEFLVADPLGDIHGGGDGFFRRDTRVLSRLRLKIGDHSPSLLSSGV